MNTDTVSVIIPIYNSEKSITSCIQSIVNQTYSNLQIICVDDGSTDNSVRIINSFVSSDKRIMCIQQKNKGVSAARNIGLINATGRYVQFVDSDDRIDENMIETLVYNIERYKADIIICGYKFNGKKSVCSVEKKIYEDKENFWHNFFELYKSTYLNPPWNKLFIREKILNMFDENISIGEDLIFNLEYIKLCNKIVILPNMLYSYSPGNSNSLTIKFHENGFEAIKKIILTIKRILPAKYYLCYKRDLDILYLKDYIRNLNGLINKSNKTLNEIIHIIQRWRNDSVISSELFTDNIDSSVIYKIIKFNNYFILIIYFKLINIKRIIMNKISYMKKKIYSNYFEDSVRLL